MLNVIIAFVLLELLLASWYFLGLSLHLPFSLGVIVLYLSSRPTYILSPRNVLFAYYTLWYVIAPSFATRYQGLDFSLAEYSISFLMLFTTYGVAHITLVSTEKIKAGIRANALHFSCKDSAYIAFSIFYALSILFALLIVLNTGGVSVWVEDPGKAFLTREGAGHFSILFMVTLAISVGIGSSLAYKRENRLILMLTLVTILVLSPVIGSKLQLLLLLMLLFAPSIVKMKTASAGLFLVAVFFVFAFLSGLYFRNITWLEPGDLLAYSLNYFSTLEMLVLSVADFEPSFGKTFFLPFNKFLTPFGIVGDIHYDMSGWLTSIYFPESWKIRATEQWPIETDLYLSFYYIFGLPFVVIFFAVAGSIYRKSLENGSYAYLFCSISFSFSIVTHLRGGVINWTDFYFYPSLFASYFVLKHQYRKHQVLFSCSDPSGNVLQFATSNAKGF